MNLKDTNLVIVDLGSFYHAILNAVSRNDKLLPNFEKRVQFNVLALLSGSYLHDLGFNEDFQLFLAADLKDYWRHGELKKFGINYKGNRGRQGWRDENVSHIKSCFNNFCSNIGVNIRPMYASNYIDGKPYGYEADDLASGMIVLFREKYKNIFVITVDSDWLPFTVYENVFWLNTANYAPRVRRAKETLEYCQNNKQLNSTIARRAFKWNCPTDLWKFKAEFGDPSDSLRGNLKDQRPGFYNKYIDLFNPHEKYRCWEEKDFLPLVADSLTKPRAPLAYQKLKETNRGSFILAVPPYERTFSLNQSSYSADFLKMLQDTDDFEIPTF